MYLWLVHGARRSRKLPSLRTLLPNALGHEKDINVRLLGKAADFSVSLLLGNHTCKAAREFPVKCSDRGHCTSVLSALPDWLLPLGRLIVCLASPGPRPRPRPSATAGRRLDRKPLRGDEQPTSARPKQHLKGDLLPPLNLPTKAILIPS